MKRLTYSLAFVGLIVCQQAVMAAVASTYLPASEALRNTIEAQTQQIQGKINAMSDDTSRRNLQVRLNSINRDSEEIGCRRPTILMGMTMGDGDRHCDQIEANDRARSTRDSLSQLQTETGVLHAVNPTEVGVTLQSSQGSVYIPSLAGNALVSIPNLTSIISTLATIGVDLVANDNTINTAETAEDGHTCNSEANLINSSGAAIETPAFLDGCVRWRATNATAYPNPSAYKRLSFNTIPDLIAAIEPDNLPTTLGTNPNGTGNFSQDKPEMNGKVYFDGVQLTAVYRYTEGPATRNNQTGIFRDHFAEFSFTDGDGDLHELTIKRELEDPVTSVTRSGNKAVVTGSESISEQMKTFFKTPEGTTFLSALLKSTVTEAPYSPVAGNPASYMAQLVNNDYALANRVNLPDGAVEGTGMLSIVPGFSTMLLGSQAVQMYTAPFTYSRFIDKNDTLEFDVPMGMTKYGKTNSYNLALGFGWKHNIFPAWSITPALHVGVEGSIDLTNGTMMYDGSLTSRLLGPVQIGRMSMALTDNISWLKTGELNVGGYKAAFDIDNLITKNGVSFNYQFKKPMTMGVYYQRADVLSGQKWYMPSFNQVGYTMTKQAVEVYRNGNLLHNSFTTKVSYMFGPKKASGVMSSFILNF